MGSDGSSLTLDTEWLVINGRNPANLTVDQDFYGVAWLNLDLDGEAYLFLSNDKNAVPSWADSEWKKDVTVGDLNYNLDLFNFTATVTYKEKNSLDNYKGLQEVTIPESIEYSGSVYTVDVIGKEAFNHCWGLKSVQLPFTLKSIDNLAFGYCTSLREIIIPDNVDCIGDEAFTGCSGLANVEIGKAVNSIGNYAFFGCIGISELRVPASVTSIGEKAFMGVNWINEIYASSTIPADAPESAFSASAYRKARLIVPANCRLTYLAHPTWSKFADIQEDKLTGSEIISSDVIPSVKVTNGALMIEGAENVRVITADGSMIYSGAAGRIDVVPGIYIVVIDNVTTKVRVY